MYRQVCRVVESCKDIELRGSIRNAQRRPTPHQPQRCSLASIAPRDERAIAVLTPTHSRLRVLDTACASTDRLAMRRVPKEGPAAGLVLHLAWRVGGHTRIGFTRAVGRAVVSVVLMVSREDCESLFSGSARVVGALCGLDRFGGLGWRAGELSSVWGTRLAKAGFPTLTS